MEAAGGYFGVNIRCDPFGVVQSRTKPSAVPMNVLAER
jgi:hypothetical protein